MIDPELVGYLAYAVTIGVPLGVIFTLFAGINRIGWRHALQIGFGTAALLGVANVPWHLFSARPDTGTLILIGAILGGIVVRAYERGMARRRAETDRILGIPGHSAS